MIARLVSSCGWFLRAGSFEGQVVSHAPVFQGWVSKAAVSNVGLLDAGSDQGCQGLRIAVPAFPVGLKRCNGRPLATRGIVPQRGSLSL
jgi:hypothetical protein